MSIPVMLLPYKLLSALLSLHPRKNGRHTNIMIRRTRGENMALQNKLGITDSFELAQAEERLSNAGFPRPALFLPLSAFCFLFPFRPSVYL